MGPQRIPQSVTIRVALKAYLSSDHISNATGKTIAITISKNAGAFGNPSAGATNATEIANGWYYVDLSTTDTGTAGPLIVYGTASATDNVEMHMMVVDAHNAGFDGVPSAVAGASAGLLINGSNSGTVTLAALTITGATTHTGNVSLAAGLTITQSTTNGAGISITGNGTGQGIISTGGATGPGAKFVGGGTSGDGIDVTTTSGDGFSITPTAGSALVLTANGTSKHGAVITGGTAGTSDGFKAVAGTGGVPIRGDMTSNITGNLSGSVGSVTGAVGSVTGAVGSVTGNVGGNVVGSVASVTGAVGSVTGNVGGNVVGSVASVTGAVGSVTGNVGGNVVGSVASVTGNVGGNVVGSVASVTAAVSIAAGQLFVKKNTALANFEFLMVLSSDHVTPATGLTVTATRSIDGGAFAACANAVSEVSIGIYKISLAATDTNGAVITFAFSAATADTRYVTAITQT